MLINEKDVYVLNPDYVMKNDLHRIILFSGSRSNFLSVKNWESFLLPLHAKIFSFFTFNRTLSTTISLLSDFLKKDERTVKRIVFPFIENPVSVFTVFKDEKIKFPKNLIINCSRFNNKINFLNLSPDIFDCKSIDILTKRFFSGPQLITFMLNNTCFTKCVYCYADINTKVKKPLSTNRILELIEETEKFPLRQINLMGGEVFLHPDWHVILKKIVDFNLSPEYISTKIPLSSKIIRSIIKSGFSNPIQISLDACFSEIMQKTLSVKSNYLPKVLQGIKALDKSGLCYRINTVLTTSNLKKDVIKDIFLFLSSLQNVSDWRITPAVNSNWIEFEKIKIIKPLKNELKFLFDFIEREIIPNSKIPILINRQAINREFHYCSTGSKYFDGVECSALKKQLFILPDGKATICEQLYWLPQFIVGDVSIDNIAEVWNSHHAKKLLHIQRNDIQYKSRCKECAFFEKCFEAGNRCWVDIVKTYGKENWDFPDPRCAFAPEMTFDLRF